MLVNGLTKYAGGIIEILPSLPGHSYLGSFGEDFR